jgi:HK97 family phage major capsid protein
VTAPVIPQTVAEFEEILNDAPRVQDMVVKGEWGQFTKDYVEKVTAKDRDMVAQFREQTQDGWRQFLIDHGEDIGKIDMSTMGKPGSPWTNGEGITNRDKGQIHSVLAPGAKLDKTFAGPGEFFQAAWHRNRELPNYDDLMGKMENHRKIMKELTNAAGSNVPSDGGFLIPEALRAEIMQLSIEDAIVRPYATVIPMSTLTVPIPAVDETSRVSNLFGGIQFFWTPESGAGQDTSAKFSQIELVAKKLMGYAAIPNELIADAMAFLAWFSQAFPRAHGWFEDIAFLSGDGVKKPLGITQGPGAVKVKRATDNTIGFDDIVQMFARMYPTSINNTRWVASNDIFPQLAELTFTPSGGTPVPMMLWQLNAQGAPVRTLLGRPIEFTEKIGPLGTKGDLGLYDFSQYLIGDRRAMSLESSNDYLFGTDNTAFRMLSRVDGQPWLRKAITPHNGSANTLSPYVVLDTHAGS